MVKEVHISTDVCLRHELHIRAQDQICALHILGVEFWLFWYNLVCFQKVREKQIFCFVFLIQVIKFLIIKISFLLGRVSYLLRASLWKARRILLTVWGPLRSFWSGLLWIRDCRGQSSEKERLRVGLVQWNITATLGVLWLPTFLVHIDQNCFLVRIQEQSCLLYMEQWNGALQSQQVVHLSAQFNDLTSCPSPKFQPSFLGLYPGRTWFPSVILPLGRHRHR